MVRLLGPTMRWLEWLEWLYKEKPLESRRDYRFSSSNFWLIWFDSLLAIDASNRFCSIYHFRNPSYTLSCYCLQKSSQFLGNYTMLSQMLNESWAFFLWLQNEIVEGTYLQDTLRTWPTWCFHWTIFPYPLKKWPLQQNLYPRPDKLMLFLSQFTVRLSYPTLFPHGGAREMYQKQCVQKLEMAGRAKSPGRWMIYPLVI